MTDKVLYTEVMVKKYILTEGIKNIRGTVIRIFSRL